MTDPRLVKFSEKRYRDGYLQTSTRGRIAYQIQGLREKAGLTQIEFAERTGKKQSTISRLENTEYGRVSVQTLLDIACAMDVALEIRFVSYPDFLLHAGNVLAPQTIYKSIEIAEEASKPPEWVDLFANDNPAPKTGTTDKTYDLATAAN